MAGQVENTRARRNCVKALFLRSSVKRYARVSRARVDFSSPFRPFLRLFSILLSPCRLFTPWLLSFFQSRRCNDSNLEVRTRHTRRQPTPISPLHRVTFSLSLFLPALSSSFSLYHDERQRSKFFVLHKQRAFTTRIHLPQGQKRRGGGEGGGGSGGGRKSKWNGNQWTRVGRGGGIASGARNLQETRVNATFSLAIAIIKSSWR